MSEDARLPTAPAAAPPSARPRAQGPKESWLASTLSEGGVVRDRAKLDDFLPDTEAISERRHSPFATLITFVLCGMVLAAVLWMAFSSVDAVASAPGIVRPAGKSKIVNHPEGGRVAQVLIKEGDAVKEGDPLIVFDAELIEQEVLKVRANYLALAAETARLEAEIGGLAAPDFPPDVRDAPDVLNQQLSLFTARRSELAARRGAADATIRQTAAREASLKERVAALTQTVKIVSEQERRLEVLMKQDLYAVIRYLAIVRDKNEQEGLLSQARQDLIGAEQAGAEAQRRRELIDREWDSTNRTRLAQSSADRDRLRAALDQQLALKRNTVVRSPIDGVVNGLRVNGAGQVMRPGEQLVGIVPAGESRKVELEARLSNNDIGQVEMGQQVTIKFQTYDWIRHGTMDGKVKHIGSESIDPGRDDSGATRATSQPYFLVLVEMDKDYLGDDPRRNRITPGMTAVAELHVGERTILGYFTDKIFSTVQGSMREK